MNLEIVVSTNFNFGPRSVEIRQFCFQVFMICGDKLHIPSLVSSISIMHVTRPNTNSTLKTNTKD